MLGVVAVVVLNDFVVADLGSFGGGVLVAVVSVLDVLVVLFVALVSPSVGGSIRVIVPLGADDLT